MMVSLSILQYVVRQIRLVPDAIVSRLYCVPVATDPQSPISPIETATVRCKNLLPRSHWLAGSNIPRRHREAAAVALWMIIGEPRICDASLSNDIYTSLKCYLRLNSSCKFSQSRDATRKFSFDEQSYRLDISRVRFLKYLITVY